MAGLLPGLWNADNTGFLKGNLTRVEMPAPGTAQATTCSGRAMSNPKSLIPVADFVRYVEEVEKAYPNDTPAEIVTRMRLLYYNGVTFTQLLGNSRMVDPDRANDSGGGLGFNSRQVSPSAMSKDTYDRLTAKADENAVGDNPSPYIVMPNCDRIDVGHMLLGLDALLHPGSGEPYKTYNVPTIDPASWVADVGTAVVWMEVHKKTGKPYSGPGSPPLSALPTLPQNPTDADYKKMEEKYWELAVRARTSWVTATRLESSTPGTRTRRMQARSVSPSCSGPITSIPQPA